MKAALLQGNAPDADEPAAQPRTVLHRDADLPMTPGSPAWLEARRTGLGGSDIAAAMNLSVWMTRYELWLDKMGELPPRPLTEPMRWGNLMEPLVLHDFARQTGYRLHRPPMMRSERYPWLIANVDGIAEARGPAAPARIVEAKVSRTTWDEPPTQYLLQVQAYMIVTGLRIADIAVLFGGSELQIFTIPADDELQQMIIEETGEFWHRHVVGLHPPPPSGIEDVKRRWGKLGARGTVIATPEDLARVEQLRETREGIKLLGEDKDAHEAYLMTRLGETGDTLVHPVTGKPLITWKLANGVHRLNVEQLRIDHPDLFAKYSAPGEGVRRFLVK